MKNHRKTPLRFNRLRRQKIVNEPKVKYRPMLDARPRQHAQFAYAQLVEQKTGWIVQNWRKGWLWLSNWIFVLIAWVAYNGISDMAGDMKALKEQVAGLKDVISPLAKAVDRVNDYLLNHKD